MRRQLTALTEEPLIEVHVVPFAAGMYEAVELSTTTLFRFGDPTDPAVIAIERVQHMDFSDRPQTVAKYAAVLKHLQDYWLDRDRSRDFIEKVRDEKWKI